MKDNRINSLFPIFGSNGPYRAIRDKMVAELITHIECYIARGDKVNQPLHYQQMIVDFTIALVRIARLERDWYLKFRG